MSITINWTYRLDLRRLSPCPYFRSKRSISCLGRIFANVWKTVLYCVMVRKSLQKAVFADSLLARNRFRTNYKATFLWDSSSRYQWNMRKWEHCQLYKIDWMAQWWLQFRCLQDNTMYWWIFTCDGYRSHYRKQNLPLCQIIKTHVRRIATAIAERAGRGLSAKRRIARAQTKNFLYL